MNLKGCPGASLLVVGFDPIEPSEPVPKRLEFQLLELLLQIYHLFLPAVPRSTAISIVQFLTNARPSLLTWDCFVATAKGC